VVVTPIDRLARSTFGLFAIIQRIVDTGRIFARLPGFGSIPIEPVSCAFERSLGRQNTDIENWRPETGAPNWGRRGPKSGKIVRHRPCNVPLSIGNVAHFLAQWTWPTETGLAG
jgi:hypothetical protein